MIGKLSPFLAKVKIFYRLFLKLTTKYGYSETVNQQTNQLRKIYG